ALVAFFTFPAFYEQKFVHLEYSIRPPEFDYYSTFLFFPTPHSFRSKTIRALQTITLIQGVWVILGCGLILQKKSLNTVLHRHLVFAIATFLFCLFVMTGFSVWLWKLVPGLPQIQFSTRWLSIYSFVAA